MENFLAHYDFLYGYNQRFLVHHGILGMKWGIRRYQPYPKGGRVKGGKEIGEAAKAARRLGRSTESSSSSKPTSSGGSESKQSVKTESTKSEPQKNVKTMSDDELRTAINRLRMESDYKSLTKDSSPNSKSALKAMLKDVGKTITKRSLEDVGTQLMTQVIGTATNKMARSMIKDLEHDIIKLYKGDDKDKKKKG